jgi:hypothetical protein
MRAYTAMSSGLGCGPDHDFFSIIVSDSAISKLLSPSRVGAIGSGLPSGPTIDVPNFGDSLIASALDHAAIAYRGENAKHLATHLMICVKLGRMLLPSKAGRPISGRENRYQRADPCNEGVAAGLFTRHPKRHHNVLIVAVALARDVVKGSHIKRFIE